VFPSSVILLLAEPERLQSLINKTTPERGDGIRTDRDALEIGYGPGRGPPAASASVRSGRASFLADAFPAALSFEAAWTFVRGQRHLDFFMGSLRRKPHES